MFFVLTILVGSTVIAKVAVPRIKTANITSYVDLCLLERNSCLVIKTRHGFHHLDKCSDPSVKILVSQIYCKYLIRFMM